MRSFIYKITLVVAASCPALSCPAFALEGEPTQEEIDTQIKELETTQRQLLEAVRKELNTLQTGAAGSDTTVAKARKERWFYLLNLLSVIEPLVDNDQADTRVRYVSPGTKHPVVHVQRYFDYLRVRIEQAGIKEFPRRDGQPVHGRVHVFLTVSSNGKVEKVEVESSSSPQLAEHTISLLSRIDSFAPFPKDFAKRVDRLIFMAQFNYSGGEQ